MGEPELRWTDTPDFHWKPEQPFHADAAVRDEPIAETPEPANSAPSYLLTRLAVGGLQGFGLVMLAAGHQASMLAASLLMVLLFAPLLLLAGFGRVPGKLLLPWTAMAGIGLAALGAYQYWRAPGEPAIAAMVLAALFLFIGQALVTAWARDGEPLAGYPTFHNSAWSLGIQVLICALAAAMAAVIAGAAINLLRQHYPGAHLQLRIAPLVTLTVAGMSWLLSPALLRRVMPPLLTLFTLALPVLTVVAAAFAAAALLRHWLPPLLLDVALASALLLAINASYRAGEDRPHWREYMEFAAAMALAPLVLLGSFALSDRVSQLGWTAPRIFAAVCLGMLAAYAVTYLVSALVSLGGGGWMQRIERANLALALAMLALIAALASPLADPARLSVQSQVRRIETGQVAPDSFDFGYLRRDGARFGHDALMWMAALKSSPDQARGAFLALIADPSPQRPAPTQIGANIVVRSGNARLPESLLARDWSNVPGLPPCLTTAALSCDAYFTDLDGDGRDEIVLVYGTDAAWWAGVMKQGNEGWYPAGTLASPPCPGSLNALRAGRFAPVPGWRDLVVDGMRLAVTLAGPAKNTGCPR